MLRRSGQHAPQVLRFESFGVRLEVRVDEPALLAAVEAILPPGWRPAENGDVAARFSIEPFGDGYEVLHDGTPMAYGAERAIALHILDAQLRLVVAVNAPGVAFVHAGVVAVGDRAVVLPGRSFAGKTTLVAELIRRGATYLSDEYAVLDEAGLVLPYPRPLSMRTPEALERTRETWAKKTPASELGARVAQDALPVGVIAATTYRPGATGHPERRSRAQGAILLLSHAHAARTDSQRVMRIASRACAGAVVLEGERGEAAQTAQALLAQLSDLAT